VADRLRSPSTRLGALAGLVMAALWAPIALVIPELPSLDSATAIDSFYSEHGELMKVILCSVSLGFIFFLIFLGTLVEELRSRAGGAWTWVALGAALMFTTALNVALGLDAAAALLHRSAGAETVWALHSAAFLLAAPAAGAGVAFFVAAAALGLGGRRLPAWSGWLAVAAVVINAGALGGFFALDGPLNSGNGLIAGLVGPVLVWLVWIVGISVSWLRQADPGRPLHPGGREHSPGQ
jgi:hypothetical protein